ncbi:MAG: hypothetical protein [Cotesia congregata filamentous virus 2]
MILMQIYNILNIILFMLSIDGNTYVDKSITSLHINETFSISSDNKSHLDKRHQWHMNRSIFDSRPTILELEKLLSTMHTDKAVFKYLLYGLNQITDNDESITISNTINFILYNFYYFHMARSLNNQCEYCLNNTQYTKIYDLINSNNIIESNSFLLNAFSIVKQHHIANENVTESNVLLDYYNDNNLFYPTPSLENKDDYYSNRNNIKTVDDLYMYTNNEKNKLKRKKNKKNIEAPPEYLLKKHQKNNFTKENKTNIINNKKNTINNNDDDFNKETTNNKYFIHTNKKEDSYNIDFIGYHGFIESDYQRQLLYNDFEYYVDFYYQEKERGKKNQR